MSNSKVAEVYASTSLDEQESTYDEWAANYEQDLCAMGYRIPMMISAVFARYVPADAGPILDAGCGGGIQAEAIHALGYGPITGIDLSAGMLEIAQGKEIYADLQQAVLGEHLDFPDDQFAALFSTGTITQGHAPPNSFDELIRITQPGAPIVFSLREDEGMDPAYMQAIVQHETEGRWTQVYSSPQFLSMPYGEPDVIHRVHVYRVN
ncbi:MAG: class I SAM-dependent methyltransferase [Pseudomonadota bacterium]